MILRRSFRGRVWFDPKIPDEPFFATSTIDIAIIARYADVSDTVECTIV
jgi:hypothetical protein